MVAQQNGVIQMMPCDRTFICLSGIFWPHLSAKTCDIIIYGSNAVTLLIISLLENRRSVKYQPGVIWNACGRFNKGTNTHTAWCRLPLFDTKT